MSRDITIDDQIRCVRRELSFRQRCYVRFVQEGRMKQADADKEIATMQAVHQTLMRIKQDAEPVLI